LNTDGKIEERTIYDGFQRRELPVPFVKGDFAERIR
jgi:hypothetical protein